MAADDRGATLAAASPSLYVGTGGANEGGGSFNERDRRRLPGPPEKVPERYDQGAADVLFLARRGREVDGFPRQGEMRRQAGQAAPGRRLLLQVLEADVPGRVEREAHARHDRLHDRQDQEQQSADAQGVRGRVQESGLTIDCRLSTVSMASSSSSDRAAAGPRPGAAEPGPRS